MSRKIAIVLTVMAAGRAMTIPFIARAGDGGPHDPPHAWLMPLVGDAAIGAAALVVGALLWKRPSPTTWAIAIAWSAVGAFDAMAALIIETTDPGLSSSCSRSSAGRCSLPPSPSTRPSSTCWPAARAASSSTSPRSDDVTADRRHEPPRPTGAVAARCRPSLRRPPRSAGRTVASGAIPRTPRPCSREGDGRRTTRSACLP